MKLQVLGSSGAEFPGFRPPAFLVDDNLLLDAGTICSVLSEEEQLNIENIFITHSHLDHIRGIPALADNIIIKNIAQTVTVHSSKDIIAAMKEHLFNDIIWPDFTHIPSVENPVLAFNEVESGRELKIASCNIKVIDVNHTVPAVGFILAKNGKTLAYTGDTGPTEDIWHHVSGIDVLIVEVSFPNSMKPRALLTKHLTCSMLKTELEKIGNLPGRILITHPKPQYYEIIKNEIAGLGIKGIELLNDGAVYEI